MTILYKHYDKEDNLLYIGVTEDITRRNSEHKCSSPWFKNVVRISEEIFESRDIALTEEKNQIAAEVPCFNSMHNIVTEAYIDMQIVEGKRSLDIKIPVALYNKVEKEAAVMGLGNSALVIYLLSEWLYKRGVK